MGGEELGAPVRSVPDECQRHIFLLQMPFSFFLHLICLLHLDLFASHVFYCASVALFSSFHSYADLSILITMNKKDKII